MKSIRALETWGVRKQQKKGKKRAELPSESLHLGKVCGPERWEHAVSSPQGAANEKKKKEERAKGKKRSPPPKKKKIVCEPKRELTLENRCCKKTQGKKRKDRDILNVRHVQTSGQAARQPVEKPREEGRATRSTPSSTTVER